MPAGYVCEGCAMPIVDDSADEVPKHGFCVLCQSLDERAPPEHIMEMRRRWEPSGWPSERAARELPSNAFSERWRRTRSGYGVR